MTDPQRRHHSRIVFRGTARLACLDRWNRCEVQDLSLKGACIVVPPECTVRPNAGCVLELTLDDGETVVRMEGEIAHIEHPRVGLVCRRIDLDSITHLRRMLELNLGDAALLERELSALISG
ncbi:MAG: PilZ domain-containing protein [Rhodocyclaceae bacterium]|jgi:hypothetical protein|nr:PilZ domain-containing protein [Rhodocyclaceae bacterium]